MKLFELRVWTKTDISALAKHLSNKDLGQLPAPPFLIPMRKRILSNLLVLLKGKQVEKL